MTTEINQLDTWYIPEGETHTVQLPRFDRDDQQETLIIDDRGDLIVPVFVEEADHDGLLLLKQFGAAAAFLETIKAAQKYGEIDPCGRPWSITRTATGYEVEEAVGDSAEEMM